MFNKFIIFSILFRLCPCWLDSGHILTVSIATQLLTPTELQYFSTYLPRNVSFTSFSTMPDHIKAQTTAYNQWHYRSICYYPSKPDPQPPCGPYKTPNSFTILLEAIKRLLLKCKGNIKIIFYHVLKSICLKSLLDR